MADTGSDQLHGRISFSFVTVEYVNGTHLSIVFSSMFIIIVGALRSNEYHSVRKKLANHKLLLI